MDEKIIKDIKNQYGITCYEITPINGGWLNQLYKVFTNQGTLLVKLYSPQRLWGKKIQNTEAALQRQLLVEKQGVQCLHIYTAGDRCIRIMDDGTMYLIMDFCEGHNETAETSSVQQMHSLGSACGAIHKAFATLPVENAYGYPIDANQMLAEIREHNEKSSSQERGNEPEEYWKALQAEGLIVKELSVDFFNSLPKGIAHEDFTSDNILFQGDQVAAIIDFDRNRYSFVWHDVGRALLSFALEGDIINLQKVEAFVKGYNEHLPLSMQNVLDALRISYCIEALWWINPESFAMAYSKASRFRDETVWIGEHWFELEQILGIKK